jgi:hypothetical protein
MGKPHELSVDMRNMRSASVMTAGVVPVPSSSDTKFCVCDSPLKVRNMLYNMKSKHFILLKNNNEPLGQHEVSIPKYLR